MTTGDYRVLIDWFNTGTVLSNFEGFIGEEGSLDGWEAFGTTPPTLSVVNNPVYSGTQSMLVFWTAYNPFQFDVSGRGFDQGRFGSYEFSNSPDSFQFDVSGHGFDDGRFGFAELGDPTVDFPAVHRVVTGLTAGKTYTASARVAHNSSTDTPVLMGIVGMSAVSDSYTIGSVNPEFLEISVEFTATSDTHTLTIYPESSPDTGDRVYVDFVTFISPENDVTERTLDRRAISFQYGRDFTDRSRLRPAQANVDLLNDSLDYMPDNPNSPLAGSIGPGKPIFIDTTLNNQNYPLFSGFIDDFEILPSIEERSIHVTATDILGTLAQVRIYTQLYPSLQTGEVINKILDEIGWPEDDRDIDTGATTVRWWWEDGSTALDAINEIVNSEGGPAIFYLSPTGVATFRDRHHRLPSNSFSPSDVFRATGSEPLFSSPMIYDIGWRNIVNEVTITATERHPNSTPEKVWETNSPLVIQENQTLTFEIRANDPFFNAVTPVLGTDYTVSPGSGTITWTFSKTSGQSIEVSARATGALAVIQTLQIRATLVPVQNTTHITLRDVDSINKYQVKTFDLSAPWVGKNDAAAIVAILLGERSESVPLITMDVNNDGDTRFSSALRQELSNQIQIIEDSTFTDDTFYVESIKHSIGVAGLSHVTTLGCSRVVKQVENVFTFDDPDRGFDDGVFGRSGIDDLDTVFHLDSDDLDEGLLGH